MLSFKRKRRQPSESELWDEFAIQLKDTIAKDNKYSTISRVELMRMKASFTMPVGSRVYINDIIALFSEVYQTKAWVELVKSNSGPHTALTVHVQCSDSDSCASAKRAHTSTSPFTSEVDDTLKHLKAKLHFKNQAIIQVLHKMINKVKHHYAGEMDWDSDSVLEIIHHKKHNHVIVRFKLNSQSPKLIDVSTPTRISNPWLEYSQEDSVFWLISVVEEAV